MNWARAGALATVRDVRGWDGRAWVLRHLAARHLRRPELAPTRPRALAFRGIAAPVTFDSSSGGLSAYYEIVGAGVYGPPPPPGATIVDVGANVGVFSAWAATHAGPTATIVAFEPHPGTAALLERTLGGLPCHTILRPCAAAALRGRATLRVPAGRAGMATLVATAPGPEYSVEVTTVDDELEVLGIHHVDFLKVDVEGAEVDALAGASRTLRRAGRVAVETTRALRAEVESHLDGAGLALGPHHEGVWGDDDLCILHARRRR